MGDIWSTDKLTLFIAFVIPGFISLQIYRLFVAGDDSDLVKKLPAIVSYSALHYSAFGWILLINTGNWLKAWTYAVVLVFPMIWPFAVLLFRDYEKWSKCFWPPARLFREMLKPEATPWDRVFGKEQYVRITLNDGRFVGGYLADGSAISTYPNDEQIYIKNQHVIDQKTGEIGEQVPFTGVLVNGSEIQLIEIVDVAVEPEDPAP